MLEILYDFAALARREDDVLDRPERVIACRKHRASLADVILDRDEQIAKLASRRCSDLTSEWIHDDFEGRTSTARSPNENA